MNDRVIVYDTTLRDGEQQHGINFSARDKIVIARRLDETVDFVELGFPASNGKEAEVFEEFKRHPLLHAKIVAFGSTCKKGASPYEDEGLSQLLATQAENVAIVGKSSAWHVKADLQASLHENLRMIEESCKFLIDSGRKVFFDAEHFFDGFMEDKQYALDCLAAAIDGGAGMLVLCDTNGGSLPGQIFSIVKSVQEYVYFPLSIHAHNDAGLAVANALAGVEAGATQVQVTVNGYGERCGNANLCEVIPGLRLKMHRNCVSDKALEDLTNLSRFVAEVANLSLPPSSPYVGASAFHDKAGLHASAVAKNPQSYRHINPALVGNTAGIVVSCLSGKSNVLLKAKDFGITLSDNEVGEVLKEIKHLGVLGFQFEAAEASLEMLMARHAHGYQAPFCIKRRRAESEKWDDDPPQSHARLKVKINNSTKETVDMVADGDGPVNALDNALRKALIGHFPCLESVQLVDQKTRVLDDKVGTAKTVIVLAYFSDNKNQWITMGCSTDIIEASLMALVDGLEYAILKAS